MYVIKFPEGFVTYYDEKVAHFASTQEIKHRRLTVIGCLSRDKAEEIARIIQSWDPIGQQVPYEIIYWLDDPVYLRLLTELDPVPPQEKDFDSVSS
jgi:hypothetical protein